LSLRTKTMFVCWTLTGLVVYALYGYRKSPLRTAPRRVLHASRDDASMIR
jgi:hypothetical protein